MKGKKIGSAQNLVPCGVVCVFGTVAGIDIVEVLLRLLMMNNLGL